MTSRCPHCGRFLRRVGLPTKQGETQVDACSTCRMIWFDSGEVQALQFAAPSLDGMVEDLGETDLISALIQTAITVPVPDDGWRFDEFSSYLILILLITA